MNQLSVETSNGISLVSKTLFTNSELLADILNLNEEITIPLVTKEELDQINEYYNRIYLENSIRTGQVISTKFEENLNETEFELMKPFLSNDCLDLEKTSKMFKVADQLGFTSYSKFTARLIAIYFYCGSTKLEQTEYLKDKRFKEIPNF